MEKDLEDKLIRMVRDTFLNREEDSGGIGYRFFHSYRVYKMCKLFLNLDDVSAKKPHEDALLTAALFHDIGRAKSSDSIMKAVMPGHDEESAKMLMELLDGILSKDTIEAAANILKHHFDEDYLSIDRELFFYADEIDEIGALDVWRMFTFAAYNKINAENQLNYWKQKESRKYGVSWLDRFKIKSIREIAEKRLKLLMEFMEEFDKEFNVLL
jgi:putative nucleotidyltransferase with HDIG domain